MRPWFRRAGWLAAALLLSTPFCSAQNAAPAQDQVLPAPRRLTELPPRPKPSEPERALGPPILPPHYGGYLGCAIPVTLVDTLRLAVLANLDIEQARLSIERARAGLLLVRSRFLPALNIGTTYASHDGTIQRTEGNIEEIDRDSLWAGLGISFNLSMSDALFAPDIARKVLDASRYGHMRVANDTLLRVADAYFNLLRARRQLAVWDETLDFLTSEQSSPLRGGSKGVVPLVTTRVQLGASRPSEQGRAEGDVVRASEQRVRALQDIRDASAELARLMHLDPTVCLLPADDFRRLVPIPGEAWRRQPLAELARLALNSRPELAENQALIEAAVARYRQAKWQPWLPALVTDLSFGGFGGGPAAVAKSSSGSVVLGESGTIAGFATRTDFDIGLMWRLDGLGVGNKALTRDAYLRLQQTYVEQLHLQDRVVAEVVRALEDMARSQQRMDVTRASLFNDKGEPEGVVYKAMRLNFILVQGGEGQSPLELLDSTRRLSDILSAYAAAMTDLERARFFFLIALGMPATSILDPQLIPVAPCPPPNPANAPTVQQNAAAAKDNGASFATAGRAEVDSAPAASTPIALPKSLQLTPPGP
jgi:outer membrane protein TolC